MKYNWSGWFDGEGDCEPPEPGKRWLTIHEVEDDGSEGEEIAVIVQRATRRVIPCTCGAKTIQPEFHASNCPFHGAGTAPIFDFDDRIREERESRATQIVDALNAQEG